MDVSVENGFSHFTINLFACERNAGMVVSVKNHLAAGYWLIFSSHFVPEIGKGMVVSVKNHLAIGCWLLAPFHFYLCPSAAGHGCQGEKANQVLHR